MLRQPWGWRRERRHSAWVNRSDCEALDQGTCLPARREPAFRSWWNRSASPTIATTHSGPWSPQSAAHLAWRRFSPAAWQPWQTKPGGSSKSTRMQTSLGTAGNRHHLTPSNLSVVLICRDPGDRCLRLAFCTASCCNFIRLLGRSRAGRSAGRSNPQADRDHGTGC
jgi:hypothetical protein